MALLSTRFAHADDGVRLALTRLRPLGRSRATFLLLHGFSQNRHAFLRGAIPTKLVERGADVYVGELRGHGLSERPSRWGLEEHLDLDLPCLFRAAQVASGRPEVHLVAHSMGGVLAYASLARGPRWASVTTLAAPLRLGRGSPLVGLAAFAVAPAVWLRGERPVPVHQLLALLSGPLSARRRPLVLRLVQRIVALTNPDEADPDALRAVLRASDPESATIFRVFLALARGGPPRLCDIDLDAATRGAAIPVAAVVGARDIFAPPPSLGPMGMSGHVGPRRVVVLPRAAHVDLTVGSEVARAVAQLLPFLEVP